MASPQNPALVMVVDDDYLNRELMEGILLFTEHDILLAASGKQALRLVQEHKPDLILLDIRMPDMMGHEVCRQMRQLPNTQNAIIMMMSALEDTDAQRQEALQAGADGFIQRNMPTKELADHITSLLEAKGKPGD